MVRLGPGSGSRKEAELKVPPRPKVAAGTSAGREGAGHEICRLRGRHSAALPPDFLLTIHTRGTKVGPGTVALEVSPEVHTGCSVGARRRTALLPALTAQDDGATEILRQQQVPIHIHILEAAHKALTTQEYRAGPGSCLDHGSCKTWGHRLGGHAELSRAVLMPESQLQQP